MSSGISTESQPTDLLFEVSWEIANMVGGIHTVLASKARSMVERYGDNYIVVGPKLWREGTVAEEVEVEEFAPGLTSLLAEKGLAAVQGRWRVPGRPRCLLIDFADSYSRKNSIFEWLWVKYGVDSLKAGWDYIEPTLFAYTAGNVIRQCYRTFLPGGKSRVVAQWHEWLVGAGLLYLKHHAPEIASVFTTHATVLGRSISGSGAQIDTHSHDRTVLERARALGVESKFSMELASAREADAFTTVSAITAKEAEVLLGRSPDVLLPNGLGDHYPPVIFRDEDSAASARFSLLRLAELTTGFEYSRHSTMMLMSAGRYEYINKGLNLTLDALSDLRDTLRDRRMRALFFGFFPAATEGPKQSILDARRFERRVEVPNIATHDLAHPDQDPLLVHAKQLGIRNDPDDPLHVIFVPAYLNGHDPLVSMQYYETLPAFDLTLFPSHYEPWGYTPLESLFYGTPTVTSDLAGFGAWLNVEFPQGEAAARVIRRDGHSYPQARADLVEHVKQVMVWSDAQRAEHRASAMRVSGKASWQYFAGNYDQAHEVAIRACHKRNRTDTARIRWEREAPIATAHETSVAPDFRLVPGAMHLHAFTVKNQLPKELYRLRELAFNMWWTWQPDAVQLFAELDPMTWRSSNHNPVYTLEVISQDRLNQLAHNVDFVSRMQRVLERFDREVGNPAVNQQPEVAYFCMEYGMHECLPIYSGGLGVLAGDHLKAASDAGLSLVAVGLAYKHGYFKQRLDSKGNQHEEYPEVDFSSLPMTPLREANGEQIRVNVRMPGRAVAVRAWEVRVGRIRLYLLDTNTSTNSSQDREITSSLYGGSDEKRLQQEMVLGIGGRKLLHRMGIHPGVYHMNEGHSAFLTFNRALNLIRDHELNFETALEFCRQTAVFTTHTPIPAGHDHFPEVLVRPYLYPYQDLVRKPVDQLFKMGNLDSNSGNNDFSTTALAIHGASTVNAVSKLHRDVTRGMFQTALKGAHYGELPVLALTNGVHAPTWLAPEWQTLLDSKCGPEWRNAPGDSDYWQSIRSLRCEDISEVRRKLKESLISVLKRRMRKAELSSGSSPEYLLRYAFDHNALLIGFARRMVPYKRATLLFRDRDNLKRLLFDAERPVVLVFAGKAHPRDQLGKDLIREIWELSQHDDFLGRVLYMENYDMELARAMVQGCDVWLNTPRPPLEASGTSGMKAAMNGVLNLSVLDGWWAEGYSAECGWAIGERYDVHGSRESDAWLDVQHSAHLLQLLYNDVVPSFFNRQQSDLLPSRWVSMLRESMVMALSQFSSARMIRQYRDEAYQPALVRCSKYRENDFAGTKSLASQKARLRKLWPNVRFLKTDLSGLENDSLTLGREVEIHASVGHHELSADDLCVQFVTVSDDRGLRTRELERVASSDELPGTPGESHWRLRYLPTSSGNHLYGLRVIPRLAIANGITWDLPLFTWA